MTAHPDDSPLGAALERRVRASLERTDAPSTDALPSPEMLRDALAGRLSEAERLRAIDQATRTREGRRELALLRVALGASREAWPDALPAARPAWWRSRGLAAAAGVLLAVGLGGSWWAARPAADPLRDVPGPSTGVSLVAASAAAGGGAATVLAWHAVPGAVRYDVEVLAPDGAVRHAASTRDTVLPLPTSAVPTAGAAADWWVRARLPDGTTRRSPMGRLVGR
ncbi:MAG: hypothetical protein JO180_06850 [Gemmatirosa sp.]|nr:hypothetical protein [Gemmatirosa sp.]